MPEPIGLNVSVMPPGKPKASADEVGTAIGACAFQLTIEISNTPGVVEHVVASAKHRNSLVRLGPAAADLVIPSERDWELEAPACKVDSHRKQTPDQFRFIWDN